MFGDIFILGFDMTNFGKQFNNIYKNTNAYKSNNDDGPGYVKERKAFIGLIDKNRQNTNYHYVLPEEYQNMHKGPLAESILTNKEKYSVITYNELGEYL